ncbi:hypothetical protein H5P28_18730 [Ruficoccus amylovorans]|uniref:Uncharacterized protein n=1 Tax=Ruficoccus amylovorans TaxID=1804625 RepID=A0A842HLG5_9BACT|nr:hypothetical protein [Ruficoccus amylovorans]MBC2596307.1 hypothetical protein [Ruficoccus amylovorans]
MRDAINVLAAVGAFIVAIALGWFLFKAQIEDKEAPVPVQEQRVAVQEVAPEPVPPPAEEAKRPVPPAGPVCRVSYPDLGTYLQGAPVVVQSRSLDEDLKAAMTQQILLFKSVMKIGHDGATKERLEKELEHLRNAFPEPEGATGYRYRSDRDSSGYYVNYYYYPVERQTDERMVDDFNHVVKNSRLDEVSYVIQALELKLEKWKKQTDKVYASGPSFGSSAFYRAQLRANRAFLEAMPEYIKAWKALGDANEAWKLSNMDVSEATRQWADFEKRDLPRINTYLENYTEESWPVSEEGTIDTGMPRARPLYLLMTVAGRQLYFPLEPVWDKDLGMAIVQVSR